MNELQHAAAALLNDWAALLMPHYGADGAMNLDLRDWPGAQGPSYYNQFAHHALLLLATGRVPGADEPTRARCLDLALRNIGYVLSITDAEFHTPHYSRGRDWGRHIGEWLNYYLLCSLEIMEADGLGSAELRGRLAAAVAGATAELHRQFVKRFAIAPPEFPGNHAVWHALLFERAGRHFQRPEWGEFGREFFTRWVYPFQHEDGYWLEGRGIVVGYAMTTALAVSLHAELTDDAAACASLARFEGFIEFSSLPDGTSATVLDTRMRYYRMPFLFLPPSLRGSASGREMARQHIDGGWKQLGTTGVHDNNAQSFAFFGSFAGSLFHSDEPGRKITPVQPATLPAARLVDGPWRAYLGWQLVPEHASRFILDTQNFVELWHATAGYLVGTGNSKYMPRFSTVRRTTGGRAYIPDAARPVRVEPRAAEVAFTFGEAEVVVRVALAGGGCEVTAWQSRGADEAGLELGLMLALAEGDEVRLDGGLEIINPTVLIHAEGGPRPVREMSWRGLRWRLPNGARVDYPVVPHNSYTQDGLPKPADYVGRLSVPLSREPVVITIGSE